VSSAKAYQQYRPNCVMITGATGGFGQAFVERFAAIGARLILTGRDAQKLAKLTEKLSVPCHSIVVDMQDQAAIKAAFSSLPPEFQAIDLLINNAGLALGQEPAQLCDFADWATMIAVNNTALALCTHLVLPAMVQKRCGHIINISSIAANIPYGGGNIYCATKAFVKQFSLALRGDLIGSNVRVTSIEPGLVETGFSETRFKGDAQRAKAVYAGTTPMTAADVAESVFWIATLPEHFNVNSIELMPTTQAYGPSVVHRQI
jgi:3-hydroxy acid dehydrogenase / malonic semialdehyde reductase